MDDSEELNKDEMLSDNDSQVDSMMQGMEEDEL